MNEIIIVDVDSTITDHWRRIRRNTIPKWPNGNISNKAWEREEVLKDKILPNCKDVLFYYYDEGWDIKYLTARGWRNADEITKEQLSNFNLPCPNQVIICSTLYEKINILKKEKPLFYIDDFMTGQEKCIGTFRQDVAFSIFEMGIHVIVFRNDWIDVKEQMEAYK